MLARIRAQPGRDPEAPAGGALAEWRRNGAGAQILADLGLGKLRVLGTPRRAGGPGRVSGWKSWNTSD